MGEAAYKKQISVLAYDAANWTLDEDLITGAETGTDATSINEELPATDGDLSVEGTVLDDTDLRTHGTRSRVIGLLDWSISVSLNYETASAAFNTTKTAFYDRSRIEVCYLPEGTTATSEGFIGVGKVETFSFSGGVDDLETIDVTIQGDSPLFDGDGADLGTP